MQPETLNISFILLYLCLVSSLCFAALGSNIMSNQITLNPQIQIYIDFLKETPYFRPSNFSINIIIEYSVEFKVYKLQQITDDLTLYSNFMISNLKGLSTNNKNTNNRSKIFSKMIENNCQNYITQIMAHSECYPYSNTQFHIIFLLFSRNTFATFTMTQRITCYQYIDEQFDEIDDVTDDIEEYDANDNNSAIIEEMKLSISDSNEFVSELQKAIKQANVSPNTLLSNHHNSKHNNIDHELTLTSEGYDSKEEHKQHIFGQQQCKNIVTQMIQIETDSEMLYFDDNAQNITNLLSKISPNAFLDLHSVLTRHIMNEYINDIQNEWSAIISKEMCLFIIETYFDMNNQSEIENVNIGKLMRRHLPHSPLLHFMMNNNSNICHKLNAKDSNLKLIQYIQLITAINGIPLLMNILNNQEGSNVIHFDLLFVFHKKIWKGITNRIVKKNNHNFMVKSKKIKKKQQYFDTEAITNHMFSDLLQILCKLLQDTTFRCNLIRIFLNCSKYSDKNKYPELIIEYQSKSICKHNLDILYAIISRKRYTCDIEYNKQTLGYKLGGNGNAQVVQTVESAYFMHSFIIKPQHNNNFNVSQFIHYGFGIMRFVKNDIYRIMPHFFVNKSKEEYLTHEQVYKYDTNNKQLSYLNEQWIETEQKFDKFRKLLRRNKHNKYATK